jgi:hypothetical protein
MLTQVNILQGTPSFCISRELILFETYILYASMYYIGPWHLSIQSSRIQISSKKHNTLERVLTTISATRQRYLVGIRTMFPWSHPRCGCHEDSRMHQGLLGETDCLGVVTSRPFVDEHYRTVSEYRR